MSRIEIRTVGQLWKTAPRSLRASSRRVDRWLDKTIRDFTKVTAIKLRRGILRESGGYSFRLRKLSPSYARRKAALGQPKFALAATKAYANSIVVKKSSGSTYSITTLRGDHPSAKLTYAQLANYLENGTRNMEPLRHWRPAMRQAKKDARKVFGRLPHGLISFR